MSWTTLSSASKARVRALINPPTAGEETPAPHGLTIRRLIRHKRHARLRAAHRIAVLADGRLVSIRNLIERGRDYLGSAS